MRIAVAQINPTVGDLDGNLKRMLGAAEEAAQQDADLVVFGAHSLTGAPLDGLMGCASFIADARQHAERFGAECPILAVYTCPVPVEDEDGDVMVMPELLMAGPDGMDSFGVPLIADEGECPVLDLDGEQVAILLENRFDEEAAEPSLSVMVEMSADAFGEADAAPAAWGKLGRLSQVAAASRAWVVSANLCGGADRMVFAGNSTVITPRGDLAYAASIGDEDVYVFDTRKPAPNEADIDSAQLSPDEINWQALVAATRDYVRKNGFSEVVVGVSGGLDSAVVTALAADALGGDHVHGVLMPGPYTSDESNEDAEELCANLGVKTLTVPIDGVVDAFHEALAAGCGGAVEGLAAENLQARVRMTHLMTLSNAHRWLVLNTGNKSEAAMGFSTLYGDTCGAFAPLGDVYKTDVYDLARWRMEQGPSIPERCLTKAPSAELYEGGVDADRLPPYELLDDVLFDHVEGQMDADDLRDEGHDSALVQEVLRGVKTNEYKRRLEPTAPTLSTMPFSKRAWPVTNGWTDRS